VTLSVREFKYVASDALWNGSSMRDGVVAVVVGTVVTVVMVDVVDDGVVEVGVVVEVSVTTDVEDLGCCAL
jgi:hypothetical protein